MDFMDFSFSNSTYTALLALFAAIFGVGYPLIIQAIGEIDKKYDSTLLLKCFEEEPDFKRFNKRVLTCIFFSITTPFILFLSNGVPYIQIFILAIASIAMLSLLMSSIGLYKLFLSYYYPSRLFDILISKPDGRYMEILDIAIYAVKKDNIGLYNACMQHLYDSISLLSSDKPQINQITEITKRILNYSSSKDAPNMLKSDTVGINFYFSLPTLNYRLMWITLQRHINNDNFDWVMNYWEYADQYYSFKLIHDNDKPQVRNGLIDNKREKFKEFHIALGAFLLYSGKDGWLKQLMRFTNQLPPKYELTLCSFTEIFDWLIHFDNLLQDASNQFILEVEYPFTKHGGVQADYIAYGAIVKYLAYSMLFLDEIDYNVRYMDPMTAPLPCTSNDEENGIKIIPANKRYIRLAIQLKKSINEIKTIVQRPLDVESRVLKALDDFIKECNDAIKKKEWSEEKENLIKDQLTFEFNRQVNSLIQKKDSSLSYGIEEKKTAKSKVRIDSNDIYEGDYRYSINLEVVIISSFIRNIQIAYNHLFLLNHTSLNYTIRYADIEPALKKLCLSEQYTVIGFGVEIPQSIAQKIPANVKNIVAHNSEILILNRGMLPYISFIRDNTNELTPLDDKGSFLYTNLDKLKEGSPSSDENSNLEVMVNYKLIVPSEIIKYIRIRVFWDITNKTFDLDKIVNADNYLKR